MQVGELGRSDTKGSQTFSTIIVGGLRLEGGSIAAFVSDRKASDGSGTS